jgi:peptidoglycan-associated lipoprotein
MIKRTLALPLVCCLSAFGLAGCPDSTPTAEPPATVPTLSGTPNPYRSAEIKTTSLAEAAGDRVFFAYDSSLLSPDAARTLQRQAAWLKASSAALTIEGHADERGTREYNLALGDRRATAVRDYLVAQGVAPNRIRTVSYGKERPAVVGNDESAWAHNRRGVSVVQ